MYDTSDTIKAQPFDKLKVAKLAKTDTLEVLSISLEKDAVFPEHASPTDVQLIVLEGKLDFHVNGKKYGLNKHQHFNFPKEMVHWVEAKENSRFLIVR